MRHDFSQPLPSFLAEMFDKQQANTIFWSPQGQFVVLAGLRRWVSAWCTSSAMGRSTDPNPNLVHTSCTCSANLEFSCARAIPASVRSVGARSGLGPGMTMLSWRPLSPCPCLAAPPADRGGRTLSTLLVRAGAPAAVPAVVLEARAQLACSVKCAGRGQTAFSSVLVSVQCPC